ncbi:MAG: hypothetical protein ABID54_14275 [Pseudomonadota bacterium]
MAELNQLELEALGNLVTKDKLGWRVIEKFLEEVRASALRSLENSEDIHEITRSQGRASAIRDMNRKIERAVELYSKLMKEKENG